MTTKLATETTATMADGSNFQIPLDLAPSFRGVTSTGLIVVAAGATSNKVLPGEYLMALTPCCNATATGSSTFGDDSIVCRKCYNDVDPILGGDVAETEYVKGSCAA